MYWFGVLVGMYGSMLIPNMQWWQPLSVVAIGLGLDVVVKLLARSFRRRKADKEWLDEVERREDARRYFNGGMR